MTPFTVYLPNGKILRSGVCQNETFDLQANDGELILNVNSNPNLDYIDNNLVCKMPEKPGDDYEFNYDSKQWVFNYTISDIKARFLRDQLLSSGPDRISPIWYNAMTDAQKQEWAQYRQDLLDITQQPDYPNVIIWPTPPSEGAQYVVSHRNNICN